MPIEDLSGRGPPCDLTNNRANINLKSRTTTPEVSAYTSQRHSPEPPIEWGRNNTTRTPLQGSNIAETEAITPNCVKTMREYFSQTRAESPVKTNFPTTKRLSPNRGEPWSRSDENSQLRSLESMANRCRPAHQTPNERSDAVHMQLLHEHAQSSEATLETTTWEAREEQGRTGPEVKNSTETLMSRDRDAKGSSSDHINTRNTSSQPPSPQAPRKPWPPERPSSHASPSQRAFLPLNISAFDFALEPFLRSHQYYSTYDNSPSPTDSISTNSPSLTPTSPNDASRTIQAREIQPLPVQNDLPPIIANKDRWNTRISIMGVKVTLMRCAVIDRAAWELERNAWKKNSTLIYKEYSKMSKLVESALLLAKELQSDGLQARCFYWMGRACGRQRYWDEAEQAFEKALQFDAAMEGNGQSKGLLPSERSDIKFLKRSVQKRAQRAGTDREQRWRRDEEMAWRFAEIRNVEFEDIVVWDRSPPWCPDTESAMQQWMQATEREIDFSPALGSYGEWKDPQNEDESLELEWVGRPFTPDEMYYIEHGDNRQAPHTRQYGDTRCCSYPAQLKRNPRDRPPPIHTMGLRPVGLGIAVGGTSDEDCHGRDEMVEITLDGRMPHAGSEGNRTPKTAVYCLAPRVDIN